MDTQYTNVYWYGWVYYNKRLTYDTTNEKSWNLSDFPGVNNYTGVAVEKSEYYRNYMVLFTCEYRLVW